MCPRGQCPAHRSIAPAISPHTCGRRCGPATVGDARMSPPMAPAAPPASISSCTTLTPSRAAASTPSTSFRCDAGPIICSPPGRTSDQTSSGGASRTHAGAPRSPPTDTNTRRQALASRTVSPPAPRARLPDPGSTEALRRLAPRRFSDLNPRSGMDRLYQCNDVEPGNTPTTRVSASKDGSSQRPPQARMEILLSSRLRRRHIGALRARLPDAGLGRVADPRPIERRSAGPQGKPRWATERFRCDQDPTEVIHVRAHGRQRGVIEHAMAHRIRSQHHRDEGVVADDDAARRDDVA